LEVGLGAEVINLPIDSPSYRDIKIHYLCKGHKLADCGAIFYLQFIRNSGRIGSGASLEESYNLWLNKFTTQFAELLVEQFDTVLSPPSRYKHAAPYRDAYLNKFHGTVDLTWSFHSAKSVLAGESPSLEDLIGDIEFVSSGNVSTIKTLLIIDDIFSRGRTVAAVLTHLHQAGLPKTCKVEVACPLWLYKNEK
jgi:hypothetical protein